MVNDDFQPIVHFSAGVSISIVEDPQFTYTITNTGGGGGDVKILLLVME